MRIGEVSDADLVLDEVKRGETYYAEFELYRNGQADPGTCELEVGDPIDLRAYPSLTIKGKVRGTDRALLGEGEMLSQGSATVPARISVKFVPADLERCFDEGAEQALDFQAVASRQGDDYSALCGTVDVIPSATGGLRG